MADIESESVGGRRLHLLLTAANICHPDKTDCDGEDAFAVRDDGHCQVFAVADGVSGSKKFGDPADFSRSLLLEIFANPNLHEDPRGAIANALKAIRSAGKKGSTTLLIGIFDSEHSTPVLNLFNLGDSEAMLFRPRNFSGPFEHLMQTELQLHARDNREPSNIPYQFHHAEQLSCSLSDIEVYDWKLQQGDVVIAATDGLTDFLDAEEITATIEDHRHDLKHLASVLTNKARAEQKYAGRFDDISVVVAYASESEKRDSYRLELNNFGSRNTPI